MMDWTDRHCRTFHRLLSQHARLYTEMVTADAVIHGDREALLGFEPMQQPVALQLGGSDPERLAEAAAIGEAFGYAEINLNVGCPSDRVQSGRFGACLMAEPELVAAGFAAMQRRVHIPVTVKCRIGIDDQDSEHDLEHFVTTVADAGCRVFVVHARKAWLNGLSPKQNREVPPLNYGRVYRLKAAYPELTIVINGGVETLEQATDHLRHVDGVMMGRAAYKTPYVLAGVDRTLFGAGAPVPTREDVLRQLMPFIESHLAGGGRLIEFTRHILGLYHGRPGGKRFRRHLSEHAVRGDGRASVVADAVACVEDTQRAELSLTG
jgi:tRNA-dihydrouridine synthase A